MNIPTETLRKSIGASADIAKLWFEGRTAPITRAVFDARGQLQDTREGAVYAYYSKEGNALYVGQTNRRVKARLHDETSPHKLKPWWGLWTEMRFVQLPDEMDRLILEFMLILAYSPTHNQKPSAKDLSALLPA